MALTDSLAVSLSLLLWLPLALSDSHWLSLALYDFLWLPLWLSQALYCSYWISPCLSLALYGSLWPPLWLPLALTATLWFSLALSGSLLLSNFAYTILDRLSRPLLGPQRSCHADALSSSLTWITKCGIWHLASIISILCRRQMDIVESLFVVVVVRSPILSDWWFRSSVSSVKSNYILSGYKLDTTKLTKLKMKMSIIHLLAWDRRLSVQIINA